MNTQHIAIVSDQFYDYSTDSFIPRGSCNLLVDVCKYIKKKYKVNFYLIQMSKISYTKYKYPFSIIGEKASNIDEFKKKISELKLTNLHFNNIDLLPDLKENVCCTATIHTNYYLNEKAIIPDNFNLKKIFVVNEKYLNLNNPKFCLIKNGIDCNFFQFKKYKKFKNPITFFFPNIPNQNKNLDFAINLIESLNKIKSPYSFKLLIAGMQGNVGNYIEGVGILNKTQMRKYYKMAHFSIIPSLSESCSLCMLESMACGTIPCVSDIPGMREYIKDKKTGLITSVDNEQEWIDKIFSTLNNMDEYHNIRKFAASEIRDKYNIKNTAEGYYKEWSKIFKF